MAQNQQRKDLVEIIKANPGCIAIIDNDNWKLVKTQNEPPEAVDWDDDQMEAWMLAQVLASSNDDIVELGDGGYGSGFCYGGDILQALAKIVGIEIQSV